MIVDAQLATVYHAKTAVNDGKGTERTSRSDCKCEKLNKDFMDDLKPQIDACPTTSMGQHSHHLNEPLPHHSGQLCNLTRWREPRVT